jgi:hypothetical protein
MSNIMITEIMYHPPPHLHIESLGEALEFIELKNIGNVSIDMTGVYFG